MSKKINMNYDQYLKLKDKTIQKTYSERFKLVRDSLFWFSWIGNIFSIFLAYFFVKTLFDSSFSDAKSFLIPVGIVAFLTLFEMLKRYIFGLFSLEYIIEKGKIFKGKTVSFLISVLLIVGASFYLSLNGAKDYVDNQSIFETKTETLTTAKVDSINNYYFETYIKTYLDENKSLNEQNIKYGDEASKTTMKQRYTSLISENNKKIDKNKDVIQKYETERDNKITEFKAKQEDRLSSSKVENKSNITAFILISAIIELIIIIGIFYDKNYDYKCLEEYEKLIVNTPNFKKWYQYNFVLELIYEAHPEINTKVMSVDDLLNLIKDSELVMSKTELDKLFKICYGLKIIKLEGNRKYINMEQQSALIALKKFFKIT